MGTPVSTDDEFARYVLTGKVTVSKLTHAGALLLFQKGVREVKSAHRITTMPKIKNQEFSSLYRGIDNTENFLESQGILLAHRIRAYSWTLVYLDAEYSIGSIYLDKDPHRPSRSYAYASMYERDFIDWLKWNRLGYESVFTVLKRLSRVLQTPEDKLRSRADEISSHRTVIDKMIEAAATVQTRPSD